MLRLLLTGGNVQRAASGIKMPARASFVRWRRVLPLAAVSLSLGLLSSESPLAAGRKALLLVPHEKLAELTWTALPEFGGKQAIIYRSVDGTRVAAAFRESGSATFKYPFDEFVVVIAGAVRVRVHGGPSFTLKKGEVAYFREGMMVDFNFSPDFEDATFLVANHRISWR